MRICIYIYIYIHLLFVSLSLSLCIHIHIYIYICMATNASPWASVQGSSQEELVWMVSAGVTSLSLSICMYIYIYIYVYMYTYIYISLFLISANLRDTCWSFDRGEMTVSANLRKASTTISLNHNKVLAREIP